MWPAPLNRKTVCQLQCYVEKSGSVSWTSNDTSRFAPIYPFLINSSQNVLTLFSQYKYHFCETSICSFKQGNLLKNIQIFCAKDSHIDKHLQNAKGRGQVNVGNWALPEGKFKWRYKGSLTLSPSGTYHLIPNLGIIPFVLKKCGITTRAICILVQFYCHHKVLTCYPCNQTLCNECWINSSIYWWKGTITG